MFYQAYNQQIQQGYTAAQPPPSNSQVNYSQPSAPQQQGYPQNQAYPPQGQPVQGAVGANPYSKTTSFGNYSRIQQLSNARPQGYN